MSAIVIATGLTPEVLGWSVKLRANPANLGHQEIARLFGIARTTGMGPLPRFITAAVDLAKMDPEALGLVFLADQPEDSIPDVSSGSELLIEPFNKLSAGFPVLMTPPGRVPWRNLLDNMRALDESDPAKAANSPLSALIVGAHTELRITSLAVALKNLFGIQTVAVCPHLVGSATREAHFAALQHSLPASGIDVILDLAEAASFIGLESDTFADFTLTPCQIDPPEIAHSLDEGAQQIIQRVCMHWTSASLRALQGGFSGSLLFIAEGRQGDARTEPMVIKIDNTEQMRREVAGYYRVKDFIGKHVPTFGYAIRVGDAVGIGMDLATMEGAPRTLQDDFEQAESDDSAAAFLQRLTKTLERLSERLYRNTVRSEWVAPFREFVLHTEDQKQWFQENAKLIIEHASGEKLPSFGVDPDQLETMLRLVTANEDGIETEVCLSHGDLNFKNIISDAVDNLWFIDWTHASENPIELDFAKLENDLKFVMSKDFEEGDLPRLREFEEYLLNCQMPAEVESLPPALKFVKWDLRYRKILNGVIEIRRACFRLKKETGWLIYQIALLKYALHTLSFDQRRGRGECGVIELLHALFSVETLIFQLVGDDFHLRIRGERPSSYPSRQRISIDQAPWSIECPEYSPDYYVDPDVLRNEYQPDGAGWAQPEDIAVVTESLNTTAAGRFDEIGRPLNPRGRTGLQGRGMLGRWGPNPAVAVIVTRRGETNNQLEVLLGRREGQLGLSLPRGFLFPSESTEQALERVLAEKVNIKLPAAAAEQLSNNYYYDARQTDNAWVEVGAYLVQPEVKLASTTGRATAAFDEIDWWPLQASTINKLSSSGARLVRAAIDRLRTAGALNSEDANRILSRTG